MSGGPTPVDARLADLERTVRALGDRVAALESVGRTVWDATESDETPDTIATAERSFDRVNLLTFSGRTLVVLGGAYLLRALTESNALAPATGIGLGFTFAAIWLVVAGRTSPAAAWVSATFHGATGVIIALPLLWEAVTRFRIVGAGTASLLLVAIAVTSLAAAVRARLHTLAWIVVLGSLASSIALTAATGSVVPFAVADVFIGVVTLWIGYTIEWVWLRWPAALVADFAVLALAVGVTSHTTTAPSSRIVAVQLLLLSAYFASVAVRTLVRGREVNLFEAVQVIVALVVGFGGAVVVAQTTGTAGGLLVAMGLISGAVCYAVAFAFVARRQGLHRNFYFYSSLGLVLVLAGSALGLGDASPLWAVLAVAASWTATRAHRLTLSVHAAAYYVASAIASGALAAAGTALVGPPVAQTTASVPLLIVFATGCLCWLMPVREARTTSSDRYAAVPRLVIAIVVAMAAAGWAVALSVSNRTDPGLVATIRTGVLALTAIALAWAGTGARFREAAWLVYPTLFVGAVKLLAEDAPRSNAKTLFVALAVYGGALIAAPRVMRAGSR
jgi:hypothetical protein